MTSRAAAIAITATIWTVCSGSPLGAEEVERDVPVRVGDLQDMGVEAVAVNDFVYQAVTSGPSGGWAMHQNSQPATLSHT